MQNTANEQTIFGIWNDVFLALYFSLQFPSCLHPNEKKKDYQHFSCRGFTTAASKNNEAEETLNSGLYECRSRMQLCVQNNSLQASNSLDDILIAQPAHWLITQRRNIQHGAGHFNIIC